MLIACFVLLAISMGLGDPENPNNVIPKKMSIIVDGQPNQEINLEDRFQLENTKIVVTAGVKYRIVITFTVQRERVEGLKLVNKFSGGLYNFEIVYNVGNYGPGKCEYELLNPEEDFPSGTVDYRVESRFTDGDENEILTWVWHFTIKKD